MCATLLPKNIPLGTAALGAVSGMRLALQAVAVLLVFRSNRVVNFAQVQIGVVAAVLFSTAAKYRPAFRWIESVCPPCIEDPGRGLVLANYWASAVMGVGVAAALGWATYAFVVRRFSSASPLVLTVATIFLAQALTSVPRAITWLLTTEDQRMPGIRIGAEAPLPFDFLAVIGGTRLNAAEILTLTLGAAAVAAVWAYLRMTAMGTAIRAASEDQQRAETLGIGVHRVLARVWIIAGLLSGLVALLTTMAASSSGTDGAGSTDALVRILAIGVIARFSSLAMAVAGGIVIGVVDQAVVLSFGSSEPLDAVLVLMVGALLLLQRPVRRRGDTEEAARWEATREAKPIPEQLRRLPEVAKWTRAGAVVAAVVVLLLPWVTPPGTTNLLAGNVLYAMVGMSLLILMGWAGQISLGQFAFAAVGAYVTAVSGLPFPLSLVAGALVGAVVAVVVGVPALKLRGMHLAVSTLALALSVTAYLLNPRYLGRHLPRRLDRPDILGVDFDDQRAFYYLSLAALALVVAAARGVRRSRTGRVLIAARENPHAVQSFGIALLPARVAAFALSGFMAAFAGGLLAYQQRGIALASFGADESVKVFMMTVMGGLGAPFGPLLGACFLAVLTLFNATPVVMAVGQGLGGLLLLMTIPSGLAGAAVGIRDAALRRVARRRRIDAPSLFGRTAGEHQPDRVALAPKARTDATGTFVPPRYRLDDQWVSEDNKAATVARA